LQKLEETFRAPHRRYSFLCRTETDVAHKNPLTDR
jgi:hypothetical protein